jgi:xylose isomerase
MKTYFPKIGKIAYEGRKSKNLLAFKIYHPDEKVAGKTMREHLLFSVAYWHTLKGASYDSGIGARIESGAATLESLEAYTLAHGEPQARSGRQELLDNVLNQAILETR